MNSFKVASLATILFFSTLSAEPSAFGAGDINNPEPYGLTQEEKQLLENKKHLNKVTNNLTDVSTHLKKVTVKSNNQSNELDSLRDRLDGLQGILENLSQKEHFNKKSLKMLDEMNAKRLQNANEFEKRLSDAIQKNALEIEKLKFSLSSLTQVVQEISKNYVTKAEFNSLVMDVNKFKDVVTKELSSTIKKTVFSGKSKAQIAKEAKKLFDKQRYTEAIKYYSFLIENKYKPARAHYMIGEIYYFRKNYSEAIAYFKKSAKLYSKASYMSVLMLYTGISMQNSGDIKNAKAFLKGVIKKYPGTKAAKIAKKQLSLIG